MNTEKVYVATIYQVIGRHSAGYGTMLDTEFSRETIVYEYRYKKFYDLLENKKLKTRYSKDIGVDEEIMSVTTLRGFDELKVSRSKHLSKKKVKTLYLASKKSN